MSKKKVSVSVDEDLFNRIDKKAKELGVSKSALMSFSTSFFLHQLEQTELAAGDRDVNVYELIKNNIEALEEARELSKNQS